MQEYNTSSGKSEFAEKVIQVVRTVPYGNVVSYGQVAAYIGVPRSARQVGRTLRTIEGEQLPWWRVINNAGYISIKGSLYNDKNVQKKLLESEGVIVSKDFTLDIEKYRFIANRKQLNAFQLDEIYINTVLHKYFG